MNKLDMNLFAFVAWLEQNRHAHSEDRLTKNDGYEWYNYMWNIWLKNSDAGRAMMVECYFIPSSNTSATTICGNCGKEKMLHNIGSGIEEPKQETLEEAALNIIPDRSTAGWIDSFGATERIGFIKGAKWQQDNTDKKYTEEDIREAIDMARMLSHVSCLEEGEHRIKYSNTEDDIINSLNKQDI